MNKHDAELLAKLLSERKIFSVARPTDDCVEVALDDRSIIRINEARIGVHPDSPLDDRKGVEHLTDPFSRLAEEKPATPACLGGNTFHPDALDMFPGPGV